MRRSGVVKNAPISGRAAIFSNFTVDSNNKILTSGSRFVSALVCVTAIALWTGCVASNSSSSGPLAVSANNGSLQQAVVSTAFKAPLVAVATRGGKPVQGVSVTFTAPSSGASGTFANGKATETDISDSNGLATSSNLTANSTVGAFSVTGTASGAQSSATFSLTNEAVPNILINAQNGSMQSAVVGSAYTVALSVVVTNNGAPVSGVQVTFTAPTSGASGTFPNGTTTDAETTDSNGVAAAAAFTADAITGTFSVSATTPGATAPAQFSLTNVAAPTIAINAQNGSLQTAIINQSFTTPFSAVVTENGNPLSAVTVTFTAPSTGASGTFPGGILTDAEMTDSKGVATSKTFTANGTAGDYAVEASTPGAGNTAQFGLTNATGPSVVINAANGSPQTALANAAFTTPLSAVVTQNGGGVSGVSVVFTVPASGASGTFPGGNSTDTETTDPSGVATSAVLTANGIAGNYIVTASTSGAASGAGFNLTNVYGVRATGGTPQSTTGGQQFANPLVATVEDGLGNPISGITVTFTAPSSGASGTFGKTSTRSETEITGANGQATSSTFTANTTTGTYQVQATIVNGYAPAAFNLTNN